MRRPAFPKVDLPEADPAEIESGRALFEEARARADHVAAQQAGMVLAMLRLGKRPGARTAPDRKSRASRRARKAHR